MKNNTVSKLPQSFHHIRGSVILLLLRIFFSLFIVDTFYASVLIYFLLSDFATDYHAFVFSLLWILHTAKFILQAYVIIFLIIRWATTTYYIHDHELVRYQGAMQPSETIYELNFIKSVDVSESWLGRLLNYGDVMLAISSSGYRQDVKLQGIADPIKYERIFRHYMEEAEQPSSKEEPPLVIPPTRTS
jgi:uncharacterized membrane protein YdbT with pleckstrin-like domain